MKIVLYIHNKTRLVNKRKKGSAGKETDSDSSIVIYKNDFAQLQNNRTEKKDESELLR